MAGSTLRYQLYRVCIWPCVTSYSWAILCIREPAIPATFWAAREPVIPGIISGFQNQVYVLMDSWFLPDIAGYLRRFALPSLIRTVFFRKPLLADWFHDSCGVMPGGNILTFYCTMAYIYHGFPLVFTGSGGFTWNLNFLSHDVSYGFFFYPSIFPDILFCFLHFSIFSLFFFYFPIFSLFFTRFHPCFLLLFLFFQYTLLPTYLFLPASLPGWEDGGIPGYCGRLWFFPHLCWLICDPDCPSPTGFPR